MRLNRVLLSSALIVVALVVQVSVLARLHLPGAVPDLMLLVVLGLALVYGHVGGALVGFGAGLLADIAPPADHAVGRYAMVLAVIGYFAGLIKPEKGQVKSATGPLFVVAGAAVSSTVLYAGVGALVSDGAARGVGLGSLIFTATLYDLLLAPFTIPLVMALARRGEREVTGESADPAVGTASREAAYRWLASGSASRGGLLRTRRGSGLIGRQRSGLLSGRRSSSNVKVGRIKGVKRL
ncbi:rod shape-determining protein MreD [Streptomyces sp. NPDC051940]|uniref:rod shape-determining protein MreD n=1 Tax=Streptomyces sp. NPDC051940 TaxID=3155675 RepID=UPI00341C8703